MARICFNALSVNPVMTGIGQYAKSLLEALAGVGSGHDFTILGSAGHDALRDGFPESWRFHTVKGATPLWEQFQLPTKLELDGFDLYHSPLFMLPIVKVCKYVMTLHDVIPLTHPELVPETFRQLFERSVGPSLCAADTVVTTSEAAKRDIAGHLEVEASRICVARQCIGGAFRPWPREEVEPILKKHALEPGGYILYVGAIDPVPARSSSGNS